MMAINTSLAASLIFLTLTRPAGAHRLDEYLQATTISLEKDRIQAQIRLTPGVAVFPFVIATIDANGDGFLSEREQRAYSEWVLKDLSLAVDGERLRLDLISARFPNLEVMKEGLGEIQIDFAADTPRGSPERKLVFENNHQRPIAAYLVNCLVPRDPDIQVMAQNRNYEQSRYELEYVLVGVRSSPQAPAAWSDGRAWLALAAIFLLVRLGMLWRNRRAARSPQL